MLFSIGLRRQKCRGEERTKESERRRTRTSIDEISAKGWHHQVKDDNKEERRLGRGLELELEKEEVEKEKEMQKEKRISI